MKLVCAFLIIIAFFLLIVGGANELQLPTGILLEETPTPAPTSVPVLALVGEVATRASEVKLCGAGLLWAAALFIGVVSVYQWLSNDDT